MKPNSLLLIILILVAIVAIAGLLTLISIKTEIAYLRNDLDNLKVPTIPNISQEANPEIKVFNDKQLSNATYWTTDEYADIEGVNADTIRRRIKAGDILVERDSDGQAILPYRIPKSEKALD